MKSNLQLQGNVVASCTALTAAYISATLLVWYSSENVPSANTISKSPAHPITPILCFPPSKYTVTCVPENVFLTNLPTFSAAGKAIGRSGEGGSCGVAMSGYKTGCLLTRFITKSKHSKSISRA